VAEIARLRGPNTVVSLRRRGSTTDGRAGTQVFTVRGVAPVPIAWWRAALVGLVVLAALTAVKLAIPAIGRPTPFLTFFVAVLVAAWQGGLIAGVVLTVASAITGYAFFIAGSPNLSWVTIASQLTVFGLEGLGITWLSALAGQDRRRAMEAMHETRDAVGLLEGVLDALDVGVTVQDAKGTLVYANAAAAHSLGHDDSAKLRATPAGRMLDRFDVFDTSGAPFPLDRLPGRALLRQRSPVDVVVQLRERGGSGAVRYAQICARAIRADDGALRFAVNTFRDVTEARRQQDAIRTSREWFSTALHSIGDAVIATDAGGRITFVNPMAESLTGWTAADAERRPLAEVFAILDEDTRQTVESPVEKVIHEGTIVGLANHTILVRKDGTEIAIDDSAAPIRGSDGGLVGVVLVFRDVTSARREAIRRELLARATEQLASSLDYEATLVALVRLAVPKYADWAAVDMLEDGQTRRLAVEHVDPLKVQWVQEVARRYPPDPNATSGVPAILRTGKAEHMPEIPAALLEAAAADDEHRRIIQALQLRSYIGVPLIVEGKPVGVISLVMAESRRVYDEADLAFAIDLADRAAVAVHNARLFRAVEQARAEAVLASRAKDDFLAMLGHELRNPLAPILTALELMKLQPSPRDVERARQVIERQVRGMVRLVDDLLDVSRIAHGRIELTHERVELAELVSKGLEVAGPAIEQRRHRVEVEVEPGLLVDADPLRLVQVIANLLNNAAKYTEPGGQISVQGRAEGHEVVLRVRDSGVGISPEMLPRVFDVFVQQPQALDRAQGGLGLGLTIVKSIVELHGGRVAAHSEGLGRGSELVVVLPAASATPAPRRSPTPEPLPSPAGGAMRVLLVDDDPDALDMLAELLKILGYEPYTATDGPSALAVARAVRPSVALLDIGLPEIDGFELGRRLRATPGLEGIELVALTGYGQPSDGERSAAAGFAAHLVKPVGIAEIRRVLGEIAQLVPDPR
jgi:PAS domain S-box-containing protein